MGTQGRAQVRTKKSKSVKVSKVSATVSEETRLAGISGEIGFLKKELTQYFEKERWSELSESLSTVIRLGEGHSRKALCLKSQTLQQWVGTRNLRSGSADYDQVEQLFGELMHQLSHLDWVL